MSDLDLATWAICPYIKHVDRTHYDCTDPNSSLDNCHCEQCPEWEEDDGQKFRRGCRALAQEAIEPVLAALSQSKGD